MMKKRRSKKFVLSLWFTFLIHTVHGYDANGKQRIDYETNISYASHGAANSARA